MDLLHLPTNLAKGQWLVQLAVRRRMDFDLSSKARRALRALSQAAGEVIMAFGFLLLMALLAVYASHHYAGIPSLAHTEVRVVAQFWESEPDRLERTEALMEKVLPARSRFHTYESFDQLAAQHEQAIVIEVEYGSLLGLMQYFALQDAVWTVLVQGRGSLSAEISRLGGPEPLVLSFWLQMALIPWLLIRLRWLRTGSAAATSGLPKHQRRLKVLTLSVAGGLIFGILAPWFFTTTEQLGFLRFSEQMPSLESFGISADMLWQAAFLFALAGAVEEAFFRGVLLRRFIQNGLPHFGVLVCAFWFTLLHFSYFSWDSGNLVYALWIGMAGLGLGFLTLRVHSWIPAAGFHAGYNFAVTCFMGWLSLPA